MKPLEGKVAVVAGATRGAGRGIAVALGEAGATVYCTGRSTRRVKRPRGRGKPFDLSRRPETIEETAELVSARGGHGVAVRVDHTDEKLVKALLAKVRRAHGGLDVLVNDVWGGDALVEWGQPFWEMSLDAARTLIEQAVLTHIITARYGTPLLLARKRGLIVEVTDGDRLSYRGDLLYDLVKSTVIRLAFAMAEELRPHRVASLAVTPGFLRSEAMLDYFGVTESNWREGEKKDPHFAFSETPLFVGRAVAALASDPEVLARSGRVYSSWGLSREFGFVDADGSRPDWGAHAAAGGVFEEARRSHQRFLGAFAKD